MALQPVIVLQASIQEAFENTLAGVVEFTPRLVGALLILLVGWVIGRFVFRVISRVADRIELDRLVLATPLGRMLGGTERAVSRSFGRLGAWFVYALAILAAADVLAVELLSEWISLAVSYLPAFVVGLLIIVVGFVLADFLADAIARTQTVTETRYTDFFADGARIFLYFIAIVIGLDTMGVDVAILYTFAQAAAWGVAAGIALALGIAFGWGGKDYVANNIGGWLGQSPAPMPAGGSGSGGGGGGQATDGGADQVTNGGEDDGED
ncbi:mechanosensitive ion channel family protein [Haloarchaeobius baliensis]|uniref:mechanosensitive ion channel family protein n=1 Tax=Haloarchaeobius baliensis TaxID=1670458 RepID=UPI003F884563